MTEYQFTTKIGRPLKGDAPMTRSVSGFRVTEADHEFIRQQAELLECTMPEYVRKLIETERLIHARAKP